ncbi:hypothetical protein D6774_00440 [Candidatus Woesearchaeota archaeon]|nr:MAG: hypothetical protein D6774_00440 [Candidatus Woesearchaeota archaeon]
MRLTRSELASRINLPQQWQYIDEVIAEPPHYTVKANARKDEFEGNAHHLTTVSTLLLYEQLIQGLGIPLEETQYRDIRFRNGGIDTAQQFIAQLDCSSTPKLNISNCVEITTCKRTSSFPYDYKPREYQQRHLKEDLVKRVHSIYKKNLTVVKNAWESDTQNILVAQCYLDNLPLSYSSAWVTLCANQAYHTVFELLGEQVQNTIEEIRIPKHTVEIFDTPKNAFMGIARLHAVRSQLHFVSFDTPFSHCETILHIPGKNLKTLWDQHLENS